MLAMLLAIVGTAADEEQPPRGDRAILAIRVDQKGSSYIIHPDLSKLEAEALLQMGRVNGNRSSFFYNVTGLTAAAAEELAMAAAAAATSRSTNPYQATASTSPASRLLLEALLHDINAERAAEEEEEEEADGIEEEEDPEWVVHGGDPISVSYY